MAIHDQHRVSHDVPREATAVAHPNIALVKYWGKRAGEGNLPAVGSISITLDGLTTTTRVRFDQNLSIDRVILNGQAADEDTWRRVTLMLDTLRRRAPSHGAAIVETINDFPTGAGLASSASGFAALVVAAEHALGLELTNDERSRLARVASGSAPRSLYGGFVEMRRGARDDGEDAVARPLLEADRWPLYAVVAIVDEGRKSTGSREGMRHSFETSPYARAWVEHHPGDLAEARAAIMTQDFERLAAVSEASCLAMHAMALAARPGLLYWRGPTVEAIHLIRELRRNGCEVFFTIDAGPQVKAICTATSVAVVERSLSEMPGIRRTIVCRLGQGARIVPALDSGPGPVIPKVAT